MPDDSEATYRHKRGEQSRGFSLNVTETANPDNDLQLITDIAVKPNNVDDSKILEERIDKIKGKAPDLDEFHTDGGYGSEAVDKKMEAYNIRHVTTAVKGRKTDIEISIMQERENGQSYIVQCPMQTVKSVMTRKRNKAVFNLSECEKCPLKGSCRIYKHKGKFYFSHEDYLRQRRNKNISKIPESRRKLRANVEATIKSFKEKTQADKLKVRGLFKASLFAYALGISINFGRIYRYFKGKVKDFARFLH